MSFLPDKFVKRIFDYNPIGDDVYLFIRYVIIGSGYECKNLGDVIEFHNTFKPQWYNEYEKWIVDKNVWPVYDTEFEYNPQYYKDGFPTN